MAQLRHSYHRIVMFRAEIWPVEQPIPFGETILADDVRRQTRICMRHHDRLALCRMLRQPVTQFVDAPLDQGRLQARDGGFGEERTPGFAPHAVFVVVEGVETRIIVLPKHPHGPIPLVALSLAPPYVQLLVEVRVVDVDLVWVDPHDWPCGGSSHQHHLVPLRLDSLLFTTGQRSGLEATLTIFLVVLPDLPCIPPAAYHIVEEFVPECQGCKGRPWEFGNGREVEAIYGAI